MYVSSLRLHRVWPDKSSGENNLVSSVYTDYRPDTRRRLSRSRACAHYLMRQDRQVVATCGQGKNCKTYIFLLTVIRVARALRGEKIADLIEFIVTFDPNLSVVLTTENDSSNARIKLFYH